MKHANDFALNLITQNERDDMHSALIFHGNALKDKPGFFRNLQTISGHAIKANGKIYVTRSDYGSRLSLSSPPYFCESFQVFLDKKVLFLPLAPLHFLTID